MAIKDERCRACLWFTRVLMAGMSLIAIACVFVQLRRNALLRMSEVAVGWAERSHDGTSVLVSCFRPYSTAPTPLPLLLSFSSSPPPPIVACTLLVLQGYLEREMPSCEPLPYRLACPIRLAAAARERNY